MLFAFLQVLFLLDLSLNSLSHIGHRQALPVFLFGFLRCFASLCFFKYALLVKGALHKIQDIFVWYCAMCFSIQFTLALTTPHSTHCNFSFQWTWYLCCTIYLWVANGLSHTGQWTSIDSSFKTYISILIFLLSEFSFFTSNKFAWFWNPFWVVVTKRHISILLGSGLDSSFSTGHWVLAGDTSVFVVHGGLDPSSCFVPVFQCLFSSLVWSFFPP